MRGIGGNKNKNVNDYSTGRQGGTNGRERFQVSAQWQTRGSIAKEAKLTVQIAFARPIAGIGESEEIQDDLSWLGGKAGRQKMIVLNRNVVSTSSQYPRPQASFSDWSVVQKELDQPSGIVGVESFHKGQDTALKVSLAMQKKQKRKFFNERMRRQDMMQHFRHRGGGKVKRYIGH